MDVNTLLDFVEELLNMYGYETRRYVGIVGGKITTAPLERETGTLGEELPAKEEAGIVYKVDLLAEKKDIERPFGRIVVRYKRGHEPVTPADVRHIREIARSANAYSALLLTVTGFTPDATEVAKTFGDVTILTPDKVHGLLGKAMTKERWWFNAPAYPIKFNYGDVKWKLKWYFERLMFINFDCIWFNNKELAYEPYWKFSYHIAPKKKGGEMKDGFFAINALTGEVDTWVDIKPEWESITTKGRTLKDAWFDSEAIHAMEAYNVQPRVKIKKPKLPEGVHFEVYRPAMEKHEAKLAAIQWVSYVENVLPEEVVITGRELVYYPWWKFHYFYRPIVKNAWQDTEWTGFKMSAVYGDIFNQWKNYGFKRDIIYYYMEKSLIRLLGRDRYVKFMRKVTLGIAVLWWNYHLILKPWYIWALLLAVTGGVLYAFMTATWGLSIVLGIIMALIFMGPGYAFLYILQDYLKRYPVARYAHPTLTQREYESKVKPKEEAESALEKLEELEKVGKLTEKEKKELEKIRKVHSKELLKKAKYKKPWWQIG